MYPETFNIKQPENVGIQIHLTSRIIYEKESIIVFKLGN
jgi:hypothetical protein